MNDQTPNLHLLVDDALRKRAAETLADIGMTLSDAVHILLTKIVA
jgi:DNA-damage-inducible protein J